VWISSIKRAGVVAPVFAHLARCNEGFAYELAKPSFSK